MEKDKLRELTVVLYEKVVESHLPVISTQVIQEFYVFGQNYWGIKLLNPCIRHTRHPISA